MAIVVDHADIGGAFSDAAANPNFTTNQTVAAGGFIVIAGGWFGASTSDTITGISGGGLTWTVSVESVRPGNANQSVFLASAQAPAGLASGTTITVTVTTTRTFWTVSGMSFTGVKTSAALDGTPPAGNQIAASTAWSTTASTVQDGSVLVGASWQEGAAASGTVTAPATEANEENDTATDQYGHIIGYRVISGTGSYNMAGTWASAVSNASVQAAYLAEPGGAPPTPPSLFVVQSNLRLS